jgi:hypothetical protein
MGYEAIVPVHAETDRAHSAEFKFQKSQILDSVGSVRGST